MKKFVPVLCLLLFPALLFAQSATVPMSSDMYYDFLDRMEIKSGHFLTDVHTTSKPYLRQDIIKSLSNFDTIEPMVKLTKVDKRNIGYIHDDNTEWIESDTVLSKNSFSKIFYRTKGDFYSTKSDNFMLKVSPVASFAIGNQNNNKERMFVNTRGVEMRSWIARRLGVYLFIAENQTRYPSYAFQYTNFVGAVPGEGYYKDFHTTGVDYLNTQGYINFKAAKFITVTFGNDKNFLGNGFRSLQLSNFSEDYLFLKLSTKVWRITYTNIFTDLIADFERGGDRRLPRKYAAFHHLSLNATSFLNVGLFEGVVFARNDGYELSYLNPIIFYRAIEQGLGSPDNAVLGMDIKANFLRHFSVYGQLLIDDLNIGELKVHPGYWANKYGIQVGAKYVDAFGIPNLDLQIEKNLVRPYVYTHSDTLANYTNYNQPLAHPLGANFNEIVGIIRYSPLPHLTIQTKIFNTVFGQDTLNKALTESLSNWGGDIRLITTVPTLEHGIYGNKIGQGIRSNLLMIDFTATYMIRHNIFIDLEYLVRTVDASMPKPYSSDMNFVSVGVRMNIGRKSYDF